MLTTVVVPAKAINMKRFFCSMALTAGLPPAMADWQFKSRPDLAPPRLNITIPASDQVENGYLFLAPFAGIADTATEQYGPRQAAPYIFRDNGDLVWSGYGYFSIWATNFQAGHWNGKDVLFSFEGDHNAGYGHGHGHTTFLDQHYETVRELRAGNHKLTDKHEFHMPDEQHGLIQVYQPVPRDLTAWGARPEQQWIVNAVIQGMVFTVLTLCYRLITDYKTQSSTSRLGSSCSNGQALTMSARTRVYCLSTLAKQDPATTVLMHGTTSISTVLTKTRPATI